MIVFSRYKFVAAYASCWTTPPLPSILAKRSVWWGKNGCGKSTLLSLLKNEISADGGSMTFPGNWQLAWVNQETPALPQPASIMSLTAIVNIANWRPRSSRLTNATTVMLSPPSTVSWTPSTPGRSVRAPPACCTVWVSAMNSLSGRSAIFRRLAYAP